MRMSLRPRLRAVGNGDTWNIFVDDESSLGLNGLFIAFCWGAPWWWFSASLTIYIFSEPRWFHNMSSERSFACPFSLARIYAWTRRLIKRCHLCNMRGIRSKVKFRFSGFRMCDWKRSELKCFIAYRVESRRNRNSRRCRKPSHKNENVFVAKRSELHFWFFICTRKWSWDTSSELTAVNSVPSFLWRHKHDWRARGFVLWHSLELPIHSTLGKMLKMKSAD